MINYYYVNFFLYNYQIIQITWQIQKNLTYLLNDIADKYPERQLVSCKTDSRTWKHALLCAAVERITGLAKYFFQNYFH